MSSLVPPVVKKTMTGDYGFKPADVPDLSGRVCLVTGGTNGIGLAFSRTLYSHGASLIVLARQKEVARQGVAYIKSGKLEDAPVDYSKNFEGLISNEDTSGAGAKDGTVEFIQCDLEALKDVARIGKDLASGLDRLDLCAFIAGKGVNAFSSTKDGYDSHLTVNNLSHHLLLSHLFPLLRKTERLPDSDVRIINMSSELHRATLGGPSTSYGNRFRDDSEFKKDVGPQSLYARTKLCNILFTKAVLQRHIKPKSSSMLTFATHPGAVGTGQQEQFKPAFGETVGKIAASVVRPFMRRPDQGCLSALWCSTSPDLRSGEWENGSYFTDPKELGGETKEAQDQELIDNFYKVSEEVLLNVVGPDSVGPW